MEWQKFLSGPEVANLFGEASLLVMFLIFVWSAVWKAIALWKASKENSKPWFIALFVINTMGILEILYIYVFSRMSKKNTLPASETSKIE